MSVNAMCLWQLVLLLFGLYQTECVLRNVAVGKAAYHPDSYYNYAHAKKAVDGSTNQDMFCMSCTHTRQKTNAWWDVDLGKIFTIRRVKIFNRMDGSSHRLRDVELYIGNTRSSYRLKKFQSGQVGSSYTFNLSPEVKGRWVKITRNRSVREYLQLCEVQVFAEVGPDYFKGVKNLALGKISYQSDTYRKHTYAQKAVDGDTNGVLDMGSCAHTNKIVNAWWDVNLGKTYLIRNVRIYNRLDYGSYRLKDVYLYIGQSRSSYKSKGFHRGEVGRYYTFQLSPPTLGNWVKITRTYGRSYGELQLCEVQVFGEEVPREFNVRYQLNKGRVGTGYILQTKTVTTSNECAQRCKILLTKGCIAFNYLPGTRQCQLLATFYSKAEVTKSKLYYRMIYI